MLALLRGEPNLTIFDVGAFRGDYGAMARQVLGPQAVIHCFEPGEMALRQLRRRAPQADLHVHGVGLSNVEGHATLHHESATPTMASLHPDTLAAVGGLATERATIDVTTLDEFCERHAISTVDLLKIDTEGTEIDVLRGATRMLGDGAFRIIQFEFGYGNIATRTFIRDFYELLGASYVMHRVAPRGLIALGGYDLALEVFVGATNYVAIAEPRPS